MECVLKVLTVAQQGRAFVSDREAILVERESHLLELCRLYRAHPLWLGTVQVTNLEVEQLPPTARLTAVPEFLSTDSILAQFPNNRLKRRSSTGTLSGYLREKDSSMALDGDVRRIS